MKIAVFGSGGVGGYFGARLARAGEEVVFIARGEHLHAMQQNGLRIESSSGDFTIYPVQAFEHSDQIEPADVILVGVKAWQVKEAAYQISNLVGPTTIVVPLQNGVEAPETLAAVLGEKPVVVGLCQISAYIASPGVIHHAGIEPLVRFGEFDNSPSQRLNQLKVVFERAGVKAEIPADIWVALWRKFLFISAISGVGGTTRAPIGVTRSLPTTRQLLVDAMQEIEVLGRAKGIRLPVDIVAETMKFIDGMSPDVIPSMQRDILAGRPSELEAQNGAVVRLGKALGVPTPTHSLIYASLLPQELRARGEVQFAD